MKGLIISNNEFDIITEFNDYAEYEQSQENLKIKKTVSNYQNNEKMKIINIVVITQDGKEVCNRRRIFSYYSEKTE